MTVFFPKNWIWGRCIEWIAARDYFVCYWKSGEGCYTAVVNLGDCIHCREIDEKLKNINNR